MEPRIHTRHGTVDLRKRRGGPQLMQVPQLGTATIQKRWLQEVGHNEQALYHKCIKQAMLLAARKMELIDALDLAVPEDQSASLRASVAMVESGRERIPVLEHKLARGVRRVYLHEADERHMLAKYSKKKCCDSTRVRWFCFKDGEMQLFAGQQPTARRKPATYRLKEAEEYVIETMVQGARQHPAFLTNNYQDSDFKPIQRLRVVFPSREAQKKSPLYLYPRNLLQLHRWKRTFLMAHMSDRDRQAMKAVVGKAINVAMRLGWDALVVYYREIVEVKKLVLQCRRKLERAKDLGRGWTKMRLVNRKCQEALKRRQEIQNHAASILSQRLHSMGKVRSAASYREKLITRVQEKFRRYREGKVVDRVYPITSATPTGNAQARVGVQVNVVLETATCLDVLSLCLTQKDRERLAAHPELMVSKVPTYSETTGVSSVARTRLSLSDDMRKIMLAPSSGGNSGWRLSTDTSWSNFVPLDRISQVVLHTAPRARVPPQKDQGSQPSASRDAVWCTVFGPRIGWGRRLEKAAAVDPRDASRREVLGTPAGGAGGSEPFALPNSLRAGATNEAIKWVSVAVRSLGNLQGLRPPKKEQGAFEVASVEASISLLGYRFRSDPLASPVAAGAAFRFAGPVEVKVPVPDERSTVVLDESVVAVEVVQTLVPKPNGSEVGASATQQVRHRLVGAKTLAEILGIGAGGSTGASYRVDGKPVQLNLAEPDSVEDEGAGCNLEVRLSISDAAASPGRALCVSPEFVGAGVSTAFYTSHRGAWYNGTLATGLFNLESVANFAELSLIAFRFPEDDRPAAAGAGALKGVPMFHVRVSMCGITAVSPRLHRNKESWKWVLGDIQADPDEIRFNGHKLHVPLPPGYWSLDPQGEGPAKRPRLLVEVVRSAHTFTPEQQMSYSAFFEQGGGERQPVQAAEEEVVYHTFLTFENLLVNQKLPTVVGALLVRGPVPPSSKQKSVVFDCVSNSVRQEESTMSLKMDAHLSMHFALRDRDSVQGGVLSPADSRSICVGDKAMMLVEEELLYPETELEARNRYIQDYNAALRAWPAAPAPATTEKGSGSTTEGAQDKSTPGRDPSGPSRGAVLRHPALSSEYADSELSHLHPPEPFRPSVIPGRCTDILPHRYVLPLLEEEFVRRQLPGIWPLVLDDLAQTAQVSRGGRPKSTAQSRTDRTVVSHLKYVARPVPVTVLATYRDGSCDVEVAPSFLDSWRRQERRRFVLPGKLLRAATDGRLQPKQRAAVNATPHPCDDVEIVRRIRDVKIEVGQCGTVEKVDPKSDEIQVQFSSPDQLVRISYQQVKDGSVIILPPLYRAILQKVQTAILSPVHAAGFHIYDAEYKSTGDYAGSALPPVSELNLRLQTTPVAASVAQAAALRLPAGPLPPDASPATCLYEWKLEACFPSENDMHRFVAMLRQSVRLEQHLTSVKMSEFAAKNMTDVDDDFLLKGKHWGGQLDVLLVEARRLRPVGHQKALADLRETVPFLFERQKQGPIHEQSMPPTSARSTPEGSPLSTMVNFRMKLTNGEVLPFKGHNMQSSPVIDNTDSPSWAMASDPKEGGFIFKTGHIDPDRLQGGGLILELEVMQVGGFGGARCIGVARLSTSDEIGMPILTNPQDPFRFLWLPVVSLEQNGSTAPNRTGELLIMTRWLPAEMVALSRHGHQAITVRSQLWKELWPKVCASRVREPIYNVEAQYLNYNPNAMWQGYAAGETPPDFVRRHVEELHSAAKYLECLEQWQLFAWAGFAQRLQDMDQPSHDIGGVRLKWINDDNQLHLDYFRLLVEQGIPSMKREQIWLEVTMALREMCKGEVPDSLEEALSNAEKEYTTILSRGLLQRSDAYLQMQEDLFHLSTWESSTLPSVSVDRHLQRLEKARNVCVALVATPGSGVVYCESLMVLAFFLLLPLGVLPSSKQSTGSPARGPEDLKLSSMSESSVYWLLRTLVGARLNGAFQEYYGKPAPPRQAPPAAGAQPAPPGETLCVGSGAMHDVALLESCLAHHEPQLWQKLNCIGFQLATVFYGAFMRLYSTYMPTSSVFRFWDLLFSQSTDPRALPHHRVYLVDLAFGVLRPRKLQILACQSALEVRDLILTALGSLYDMSTVVEITLRAHKFLWDAGGYGPSKVAYLCQHREDSFKILNFIIAEQNRVLQHISRDRTLGRVAATRYEAPAGIKGVTTKEILAHVAPTLRQGLASSFKSDPSQRTKSRTWAMHRPMPLASKIMGEDVVQQTYTLIEHSFQGRPKEPDARLLEVNQAFKVREAVEPDPFGGDDLEKVLQTNIPNWKVVGAALFDTFADRQQVQEKAVKAAASKSDGLMGTFRGLLGGDRGSAGKDDGTATKAPRVSLNDVLVALICCSKGTLVEKAAALFSMYAYTDALVDDDHVHHIVPKTPLTRSLTDVGSGDSWNLAPPQESAMKEGALHFKVMSDHPQKGTHLGDVFIPTVSRFVGFSPSDSKVASFNIWSGPRESSQDGRPAVSLPKVTVGDIEIAILWIPRSAEQPNRGQFCVQLKAIRFNPYRVKEPMLRNPYVEVYSYATTGNERKIRRWDPQRRTAAGFVGFDATRKNATTTKKSKQSELDQGIGWAPTALKWLWNERLGRQWSEEIELRPQATAASQQRNVIDMPCIRVLVTGILQRALLNFTNRQAMLLADAAFNRAGAVPGILEAVLVELRPTDPRPMAPTSPKDGFGRGLQALKKEWGSSRPIVDVTDKLSVEHERQIQCTGLFNLFTTQFFVTQFPHGFYLKDMGIRHGFSREQVLWIRYVRGGDGERCTQGVVFDAAGKLKDDINPEIRLDLLESWPREHNLLTKVTKGEFVSCLLGCPVLGESLRRLASTGAAPPPKKALSLDVVIAGVSEEDRGADLMDMLNAHQSILLEVWDDDFGSKDFLGEAWLPALSRLTPQKMTFVLPLKAANYTEEADPWASRQDDKKDLGDVSKNPHKAITGELHVTVAWLYPAYEVASDSHELVYRGTKEGQQAAAKKVQTPRSSQEMQQKIHTGELTLEIHEARGLRKADKSGDPDPQVFAYVRNDKLGMWRRERFAKTSVAKNTRNASWKNEPSNSPLDLVGGAYEVQNRPRNDTLFNWPNGTGPSQKPVAKKGFGAAGLKLRFFDKQPSASASPREEGSNHGVEVYWSDSVHGLKAKLMTACAKEAAFWENREASSSSSAQLYRDVKIDHRHLVMVFVPSQKMAQFAAQAQQLAQTQPSAQNPTATAEYKDAEQQALSDPSSWEPLEVTRTFEQYSQFGFGRNQMVRLQIVEAKQTYKWVNTRYKEFDRRMHKQRYVDTNEPDKCYGFAKYMHKADALRSSGPGGQQDCEWRPAFIKRSNEASQARYVVDWVFRPGRSPGNDATKDDLEVDQDDVILVPRSAHVDDFVHPGHRELLNQAKALRLAGRSDWEIEVKLNQQLARRNEEAEKESEEPAPPITVDIIRKYIQRVDNEEAATKDGGTGDQR